MNAPVKIYKRRLVFVLLLVTWFLKFIFGLIAATDRHAVSYPTALRGFPYPYMGDVEFYVVFPAALVVLNVLLIAFASKLPKWLVNITAALQIFLLLILLLFSTGGI